MNFLALQQGRQHLAAAGPRNAAHLRGPREPRHRSPPPSHRLDRHRSDQGDRRHSRGRDLGTRLQRRSNGGVGARLSGPGRTTGTSGTSSEYPEVYEQGKLVGPRTPRSRACSGPRPASSCGRSRRSARPATSQGWAPAIEFRDRRHELKPVSELHRDRCYTNVLVTDEWNPLDPPGGHQPSTTRRGSGTLESSPG